jgi:hypothetical protein
MIMASYSKQFLIDAFVWRYMEVLEKDTCEQLDKYIEMVTNFYDKVGKDKFRVWCSLDAEAILNFRLATGQ